MFMALLYIKTQWSYLIANSTVKNTIQQFLKRYFWLESNHTWKSGLAWRSWWRSGSCRCWGLSCEGGWWTFFPFAYCCFLLPQFGARWQKRSHAWWQSVWCPLPPSFSWSQEKPGGWPKVPGYAQHHGQEAVNHTKHPSTKKISVYIFLYIFNNTHK